MKLTSRQRARFERRAPVREPYDAVLIICEGEVTEPSYFHALIKRQRLNSANVRVVSARKSDPKTIVEEAVSRMASFDRVYCVFDRDTQAASARAIATLKSHDAFNKGQLCEATSNPCFEFWFLLHFEFCDSPFVASASEKACEAAVRKLKKHMRSYAKNDSSTFEKLEHKTSDATRNAERLRKSNASTGNANPETSVDRLVTYLLNLKS